VQSTPTVLLDGKSLDLSTVLVNPAAFGKLLGVN
jgi:hypothetical protein